MTTNALSTQPTNVSTRETPRPPDKAVVTSDLESEPAAEESKEGTPKKPTDAAGSNGSAKKSESATDDTKDGAHTRNRSAERRISKLSAKLADYESRDHANAATIQKLEKELADLKAARPKPKEPQLKDFDSPREYAKAFAKWEKDSADEPPPKKQEQARSTAHDDDADGARKRPAAPPDEEIVEFRNEGKSKHGDRFMEALTVKNLHVSKHMGDFLLNDIEDVSTDVYIYLAEHPEVAKSIYYAPHDEGEEQLEALAEKAKAGKLLKPRDAKKNDEPKKDDEQGEPRRTTKAPEPPSGTKPDGETELGWDPESAGMDDYAARRRKEIARSKGYIVD